MNILFLGIAGITSGICASMGIGGGFILLLFLTILLGQGQLDAQLINLLFFPCVSILAIFFHIKHKLVDKKFLLNFLICGIIGTFIGTYFSQLVDAKILSKLFAIFIFLVGIKNLFTKSKINTAKRLDE